MNKKMSLQEYQKRALEGLSSFFFFSSEEMRAQKIFYEPIILSLYNKGWSMEYPEGCLINIRQRPPWRLLLENGEYMSEEACLEEYKKRIKEKLCAIHHFTEEAANKRLEEYQNDLIDIMRDGFSVAVAASGIAIYYL